MCRSIGEVGLFVVAFCLLLLLYFGAPLAVFAETHDLLTMDSQTEGVVTEVEIERGNRGTSAARVTYRFVVNGTPIESQRMYRDSSEIAGRFRAAAAWQKISGSGSGALSSTARHYPHTVHFNMAGFNGLLDLPQSSGGRFSPYAFGTENHSSRSSLLQS